MSVVCGKDDFSFHDKKGIKEKRYQIHGYQHQKVKVSLYQLKKQEQKIDINKLITKAIKETKVEIINRSA